MKNKKKIIIIAIIIGVLALIGSTIFYILNKQDKETTLTIIEKQWLEKNKNDVIDLSIVNNVPFITYEGSGLLFDFLSDFEKITGLEFNKVSYNLGNKPKTDYSLNLVDSVASDEILIYQDNYALITKEKAKYNNISDIPKTTVGILSEDVEKSKIYLEDASITYVVFDSVNEMFEAIKTNEGEIEQPNIDGFITLKTTYLDQILKNDLTIAYNITEYTKDYALKMGKVEKLNVILKKYFQKWSSEQYTSFFNKEFASDYLKFINATDEETAKFRSKRYAYAFVNNSPYDFLIDGKMYGINNYLINSFKEIANIEISYQQYNSINKIVDDMNINNLDFFFNNIRDYEYRTDVYDTLAVYPAKAVIISSLDNQVLINSIHSLEASKKKILTVKDSRLSYYLATNNINAVTYDSVESLISRKNKDNIIVIDYETYNYYRNSAFKDYNIDYEIFLDTAYKFSIRDTKDNELFIKFFDFYLAFTPTKTFVTNGYSEILNIDVFPIIIKRVIFTVGVIGLLIGAFFAYKKIVLYIRKDKKMPLSKAEKLKYVDMLTSLKNRNYLNDNIALWDESEVYPQTIIIVDLNNVAYINDNYGHEEGDAVICEAASILIKNQMTNSDIVRTNGNEFLIYLVGYEEKEIIPYIRKLSKELKEIAHGFGAAVGYSMINDGIKTIDDAVNEATIEMRNNKEEINN